MIPLLVALGSAFAAPVRAPAPCSEPSAVYLDALADKATEVTYLCLIEHGAMKAPLVQRIGEEGLEDKVKDRYTRALALHLLYFGNQPFDAADVRLLNPSDRRLLADGVRARRGRRSPVEAHDKVFQKQGWYHPMTSWSPSTLRPVDQANIAMADRPPPEDLAAPEAAALPPEAPVEVVLPSPEAPSGCSCATPAAPGAPWLALGGLGLFLLRRRWTSA